MNTTPISNRLHISIFGKRNAGKSSLINALTNQEIAVVSNIPGTTTDPVYKTMELLPLGPVVIIDTAGMDDEGELGNLRVEKSYDVLRKTNLAIIVLNAEVGLTEFEHDFAKKLKSRGIPAIGVVNKCDLKHHTADEIRTYSQVLEIPVTSVSSINKDGIEELKNLIGKYAKPDEINHNILGNLISKGDLVVLVTPIDSGAPKGRMILPQQQVIRDVLDSDAIAVVTKENTLLETFASLNRKPSLVVTDSQEFRQVAANTPNDIPLTSFSILIARQKGELTELVNGIKALKKLKQGSRVLIVEGCTHHRQADDIGKVKIPRWIRQFAGEGIEFEWASGTFFPKDIERFDAIVHCGGCMLNSQEMCYRINLAVEKNVAITNYGMLIAYVQGIIGRALKPFGELSDLEF